MYYQSIFTTGPGSSFQNAGAVLFNNTTGGSLVLWDASIDLAIGTPVAGQYVPFSIFGAIGYGAPDHSSATVGIGGFNLGVPGTIPVGLTYTVNGASTPTGYVPQLHFGNALGTQWYASWRWQRAFPLINIPPNYGFFLWAVSGGSTVFCNNCSVGFWYENVLSPYP